MYGMRTSDTEVRQSLRIIYYVPGMMLVVKEIIKMQFVFQRRLRSRKRGPHVYSISTSRGRC